MSTRCQIMFHWGKDETAVRALIYRHSDGYPDGVLPDLDRFFDDLDANLSDKRYSDPCYLASKLLVWLTHESRIHLQDLYEKMAKMYPNDNFAKSRLNDNQHICDFLGHGITMYLYGDIEYLYHIHCNEDWNDSGRPKVTWEKVTDEVHKRYAHLTKAAEKEVKIPAGVIQEGIPSEAE